MYLIVQITALQILLTIFAFGIFAYSLYFFSKEFLENRDAN